MVDAAPKVDRSPAAVQRAAEDGDQSAQCELGMMYEHGLAMPKDYQAAIFWYRTAADSGSEYAQCKLATMYEHGHGVAVDFAQALHWLRKAAESGLPEAQYKIGFFVEQGKGIQQKHSEAATWYMSAAEQGMPDAQFRLGLLYQMGQGVPRDPETAARYYHEAALKGNANAQYNLGVMYVTGEGVKKDLTQARQMLEAAAAHGHAKARVKYEEATELDLNKPKPAQPETLDQKRNRQKEEEKEDTIWKALWNVVKRALIPATPSALIYFVIKNTPLGQWLVDFTATNRPVVIAVAVVFTAGALLMVSSFFKLKTKPNWFELTVVGLCALGAIGFTVMLMSPSAQIGYPTVATKDSKHHHSVSGGTRSGAAKDVSYKDGISKRTGPSEVEKTNSHLLKQAKSGDDKSQVKLALRYETGTGLDQSAAHATQWYAAAAKADNEFAQCRLGMMYMNGLGVKTDYLQATKWLQKSASHDFAPADYQLGLMYEVGQGVAQSYKNAVAWYQKGASLQEPHNQYRLGLLCMEGKGAPRNLQRGTGLLRAAAKEDLPDAAARLAELYKFGIGVKQSDALADKWEQAAAKKLAIVLPGTDEWLYRQADESTLISSAAGRKKKGAPK